MLTKAIIEIEDLQGSNVTVVTEKQRAGKPSVSGSKYRFVVQFNPSELEISSSGGVSKIIESVDGGTNKTAPRYENRNKTWLRFRLIFDSADNSDAFLYENINMNMDAATGAGLARNPAAINNLNHKSTPGAATVQYQVEGFIAAIMLGKRKMTFSWGNMSYSGYLNSIDGQYTMFSPTGNPIRAEINIGMLCEFPKYGTMGQWQTQYEKFFKK